MTGEVTRLGQSECEIEVRENWGIRVVVLHDGKEKVVWGKELKRCAKQTHDGDDPYAARNYHKRVRRLLKDVKVGTVVEHPVGQEYVSTKVLRIVRAGSWQSVLYSVPISKCIHDKSVRLTKRMIERARRDNRLYRRVRWRNCVPPLLRDRFGGGLHQGAVCRDVGGHQTG